MRYEKVEKQVVIKKKKKKKKKKTYLTLLLLRMPPSPRSTPPSPFAPFRTLAPPAESLGGPNCEPEESVFMGFLELRFLALLDAVFAATATLAIILGFTSALPVMLHNQR